jgi:hypothetical protein
MKDDKRSKVLKMIATDMGNDAKNFDGLPFNGKTVAEYFGNQGAAIAALSDIILSILDQINNEDTANQKINQTGSKDEQ